MSKYAATDGVPATKQRATFAYQENPGVSNEVKEVLALFDHDKTGVVTTSDLMAAARAQQELMNQNRHLKTVMKVLLGTLVGTLVCVFGLTVLAIELQKETKVSDVQVLVTPAGEPVQVESSQLVVAASGELRNRAAACTAPGDADHRNNNGYAQCQARGYSKRYCKTRFGAMARRLEATEAECDAAQAGGVVKVSGTPTYELFVDLAEERLLQEEGPWAVEVSAEVAEGLLGELAAAPDTQVLFGFFGAADGEDGDADDADIAEVGMVPGNVGHRNNNGYAQCMARGYSKRYCRTTFGAVARRLGATKPQSIAEGSFQLRAGSELEHGVRRPPRRVRLEPRRARGDVRAADLARGARGVRRCERGPRGCGDAERWRVLVVRRLEGPG